MRQCIAGVPLPTAPRDGNTLFLVLISTQAETLAIYHVLVSTGVEMRFLYLVLIFKLVEPSSLNPVPLCPVVKTPCHTCSTFHGAHGWGCEGGKGEWGWGGSMGPFSLPSPAMCGQAL